MPNARQVLGIIERAAWTFVAAFAGVVVATGKPFDLLEVKVAVTAGVISVAKNVSMIVYGNSTTTAPKSEQAPAAAPAS